MTMEYNFLYFIWSTHMTMKFDLANYFKLDWVFRRKYISAHPLHSYMTLVTLKIRSRSPKPNHCLRSSQWCFCVSLVITWPLVQKIEQTRLFHSFFTLMTLKIRKRSLKSNHFLMFSQWCIYASLVKVWPLVQKKECRQGYLIVIWACPGELEN